MDKSGDVFRSTGWFLELLRPAQAGLKPQRHPTARRPTYPTQNAKCLHKAEQGGTRPIFHTQQILRFGPQFPGQIGSSSFHLFPAVVGQKSAHGREIFGGRDWRSNRSMSTSSSDIRRTIGTKLLNSLKYLLAELFGKVPSSCQVPDSPQQLSPGQHPPCDQPFTLGVVLIPWRGKCRRAL